MKHNRNKISSNKGQMTVEMVLIISILVGVSIFVKDSELFKNPNTNPIYQFISGPWTAVKVMMESGIWMTDPRSARGKHPNHFTWMYSKQGKEPK